MVGDAVGEGGRLFYSLMIAKAVAEAAEEEAPEEAEEEAVVVVVVVVVVGGSRELLLLLRRRGLELSLDGVPQGGALVEGGVAVDAERAQGGVARAFRVGHRRARLWASSAASARTQSAR